MAEEEKKENKKKEVKEKKKSGSGKLIFFMVIIGCLVPFGVPTLIVCTGLIPTLIALLTDTDKNKSSLATIGYLNFAGVLPFLLDLWMNGQTMAIALRIVKDPTSWVVMLGAAGIGHLILYSVPPAIASMVITKKANRLVKLKEAINQLENIWGPDVATNTPLDVIRRKQGQ